MVLLLRVLIGLYGDNCVPFINTSLKLQREGSFLLIYKLLLLVYVLV